MTDSSRHNDDSVGSQRITACPKTVHDAVKGLKPGDHLRLMPGVYTEPIVLKGLRGTPTRKITISGTTKTGEWRGRQKPQKSPDCKTEAVLTSGIDAATFRPQANRLAALKQATGEFPGLYFIADEAQLYLRDCQHVNVQNLYFNECWPTAIYLDNCQDIGIYECQFRWGTYAIGATGVHTRHLSVERCRWVQNPDNVGHWKTIPWHRIHGHINNALIEPDFGKVNEETDYRHFDGDFFVAWRIAGFVRLRENVVQDAFNAIHLFNFEKDPSRDINLNVLIENNRFERIRDNAIEPEYGAWNWVVRNNVFIDVYSWFSLDMKVSGWFYIYGNLAWHTQESGPGLNPPKDVEKDLRIGGVVFKLPSRNVAEGPHYFFHNSLFLRERIAKKKRLAKLKFFNNAISYCNNPRYGCGNHETLFANSEITRAIAHDPEAPDAVNIRLEKKRFTKHWKHLEIEFFANLIDGPDEIDDLRDLDYPIGKDSIRDDPKFRKTSPPEKITENGLNLRKGSPAERTSVAVKLQSPGIENIKVTGGQNIGAWQDKELYQLEDEFDWIELWLKQDNLA